MRKLLILCGLAFCFVQAKAQYLQATPSTTTNGTTITVKAVGESLSAYYSSMGGSYYNYTVASPNQNFYSYASGSQVINGVTTFNINNSTPTQFQFKAVNTFSQALTVTFYFYCTIKNQFTGNLTSTTANFTVTINPTPTGPGGGQSWLNNVAFSGTYYKNNCGPGYYGSAEYYSIPAGTYQSSISQADANSKASAALATLGQANANANGTCTAFTPCVRYTLTTNQGFSTTYQWRKCDGTIATQQMNAGNSTTICAQQGTVTGGPYSTQGVPCQ